MILSKVCIERLLMLSKCDKAGQTSWRYKVGQVPRARYRKRVNGLSVGIRSVLSVLSMTTSSIVKCQHY